MSGKYISQVRDEWAYGSYFKAAYLTTMVLPGVEVGLTKIAQLAPSLTGAKKNTNADIIAATKKALEETIPSLNTTLDLAKFNKSIRMANIEYTKYQPNYLQNAYLYEPNNKYLPRANFEDVQRRWNTESWDEFSSLRNYIEYATLLNEQQFIKQITAAAVFDNAQTSPIKFRTAAYEKYNIYFFQNAKEDYDKFQGWFYITEEPVKGGTNSKKTQKKHAKHNNNSNKSNNKTRKTKHEPLVVQ